MIEEKKRKVSCGGPGQNGDLKRQEIAYVEISNKFWHFKKCEVANNGREGTGGGQTHRKISDSSVN